MKRIIAAFQMFWIVLTKPFLFQPHLMKTVESLFKFLEETAKNEKPMSAEMEMACLAHILWGEGDERETALILWCGVNDKNNPLNRLRELAQENERLKSLLNS